MDNKAYEKDHNGSLEKTIQPIEDIKISPNDEPPCKIYTFEEAVGLTGIGKFHYFLQLISGLCLISATIDTMGTSVVMPFIRVDINATNGELGLLASSAYLGVVLSAHAFGFLSDTWGRAKMLRTTITLSFTTGIISAFSVNIWMLITFRFLSGFIISGCNAVVYSYLGEFHSKKSRVRYITMLSMFVPMGLMIIPALGLAILPLKIDFQLFGMQIHAWRVFLLVISFLRVFAFVGLFILPESPKFDLMQGHQEKSLKTLRKVFSTNTGQPSLDYPVHQIFADDSGGKLKNVSGVKDAFQLIWTQTVPLFAKDKILHTMNLCFTMFILYFIGQGTFMWLPTMLKLQVENEAMGYTTCEIMSIAGNQSSEDEEASVDTTMFIVLIIIGAVMTIIYFAFSRIIHIVGKKKLLFCWMVVGGIACAIYQYMVDFVWSIVVFTIMMSLNSSGGIVSTIAMEFFPTNVSAMGMSLIMMIARIGSFAGSNFVAFMIFSHCNLLYYLFMGLCFLFAIISIFLPTSKTNMKPPTEDKSLENH